MPLNVGNVKFPFGKRRRSNQRETVKLFIAQFIKLRIDRFDEGRSATGRNGTAERIDSINVVVRIQTLSGINLQRSLTVRPAVYFDVIDRA